MKIQIKGTDLELTDALKGYVDEKIGHLEHYLDNILEARVDLGRSTHHQTGFFRCEVNLDLPEMYLMRAESTESDLYAAIDTVIPKLKEQIETYKGRKRAKDRNFRRYMKTIFAWFPWKRK